MERRKFIIGAGALGAGLSTAIGTGAFTSVEAERSFDISTAGDSEAYLRLQPVATNQYVDTNGGTLSVTLDDVNQNAVTTFEDLFQVSNYGTQPVGFYVQDDGTEAVSFTAGGNSIEGSSNAVSLGVGEEAVVSVTVDTNEHSLPESYNNITVVADSSLSGTDLSDSNTVFVSQSDSQADFTSIQTAVDALADRTENTVLVAGEEFDEQLDIGTSGIALRSTGGTTLNGGVRLNSDGITISGFELTGKAPNRGTGTYDAAIYIEPSAGHNITQTVLSGLGSDSSTTGIEFSPGTVEDVTISSNDITGFRTGTYIGTDTTATITHNNYTDNSSGVGGIESGSSVTITNNVFDNNSNEAVGIGDGSAEIHKNDFNESNAASVNNYSGTPVDATNNWWGTTAVDNVPSTWTQDGPVNYKPIATEPFDTGTVTVAQDGSGDFDTVQAAVNNARNGDRIEISGEHTVDNVDITTPNVVLTESNAGATIRVEQTAEDNAQDTAFKLGASGVEVSDLSFQTASSVDNPKEILIDASDVVVSGNSITREHDVGVLETAFSAIDVNSAGVSGVVIENNDLVRAPLGLSVGVSDIEVTARNNTVTDAGSEGIYAVGNSNQRFTIENNTVESFGNYDGSYRALKITSLPSSINGVSPTDASGASEEILSANPNVASVQINGNNFDRGA